MSPEHTSDNANIGGEFQFTVNITPNDYSDPDGPIVPAEDGLLTAPDGSVLTPYSLLELSQKSATTQRRQRKKTNDRNGDYIPRPPNPFILFRCWYTAKVHKPGSHDNADGSLSSLCGQEWANLGTQQRQIFEEAAKIEKLKHAERYPNYRYKPIHKKKQKAAVATAADIDEEEARPTRSRTKKISGSSRRSNQSNSATPTNIFPPPPVFVLPAGLRHRRSSSVPPLPSELMITESLNQRDQNDNYKNNQNQNSTNQFLRPIEIPAAPFLALAGQDIPPSRKSRGSIGWDWTRGMSQILNEVPMIDFNALRASHAAIPALGAPRQRAQPVNFQSTQSQYTTMAPPSFFVRQFDQQESTIQWTNPNPFAASNSNSNSPRQHGNQLPQLGNSGSTSGSSCSAPSPPPELEISPLDPVPGTESFTMNLVQPTPISHNPYSIDSQEAQPFDLGLFKRSLDLNAITGHVNFSNDRPRGMSIFDDPQIPASQNSYISNSHQHLTQQHHMHPSTLSSMTMNGTYSTEFDSTNDMGYARALNTSNILAGVPAHEEIMEGFA